MSLLLEGSWQCRPLSPSCFVLTVDDMYYEFAGQCTHVEVLDTMVAYLYFSLCRWFPSAVGAILA